MLSVSLFCRLVALPTAGVLSPISVQCSVPVAELQDHKTGPENTRRTRLLRWGVHQWEGDARSCKSVPWMGDLARHTKTEQSSKGPVRHRASGSVVWCPPSRVAGYGGIYIIANSVGLSVTLRQGDYQPGGRLSKWQEWDLDRSGVLECLSKTTAPSTILFEKLQRRDIY